MDRIIADLRKLVEINSVSARTEQKECPLGEGVRKVLDTALDICGSYGFRTKNCDNMIGYAETGQGEELMGILVHLDVVPAGDGWNYEPFALTVEDGKLIGRGVTDDKGPAAAVIHAIRELLEEGCVFNKRIRIIFGMTEEAGDWIDMEYYKQTEEKIDFGFTPDADFPAIYAEMGIANVRFTFDRTRTCFEDIEGGNAVNMVPDICRARFRSESGEILSMTETGKSAHGSTPQDGENAISKLMTCFQTREDCQLSSFFRDCIKMEYHGESLNGYAADKESGEITYNFGMIRTDGDTISLTADIRYPVTFRIEDILEQIRKHMTSSGYGDVKMELLYNEPYVFLEEDGPVITKLLEAYREHTGDMGRATVIGGGTYARAMENIVAFGPMLPGRELTEHQANEYMFIEDLRLAKDIYKSAIRKLAAE